MLLIDQLAYNGPEGLADAMNCNPRDVRREILAGRGPKLRRFGKRALITKADAEEWLKTLPIYEVEQLKAEKDPEE
jgi:hypothetical protein